MGKDEFNAFLGAGTVYQGKLTFLGAVRIDGHFIGEIRSEGTLILGKDAQVQGQIQVNQLILGGHVNGDVIVTGKTIMHKTANLQGNLTTKNLIMEEGALLQGNIIMEEQIIGAKETPRRSLPEELIAASPQLEQ